MHFLSDGGWNQVGSSNTWVSANQVQYGTAGTTNDVLEFRKVTVPTSTNLNGAAWRIKLYATSDTTGAEDSGDYVTMCSSSSSSSGRCDTDLGTATHGGWVVITASGSNTFYTDPPVPPNTTANAAREARDKRFRIPGASCANGLCEALTAMDLLLNGSTTTFTCVHSIECKVEIGPQN
jgi:hypothetical protein